jgi:CP family cyanate transporter-like MFS transporter
MMRVRTQLSALVAVLVLSVVLRPPLAAVGPLLPEISNALQLNALQQGVLSAIPVLAFGIGAFVGPLIAKRFGLEKAMFLMVSGLLLAIALRGWFGFASLLTGTAVAGLAIAVANVLIPSVVRERFPNSVAKVTAAYTSVLALSASFAAATAVPASVLLNGWNPALMIWLLPGLFALVYWWFLARETNLEPKQPDRQAAKVKVSVYAQSKTWSLFLFFGIQSLGFYAILAWLPTLLIDRGFDPASAGALLGLVTIVGVPTGLALSANFGRLNRLDWAGFVISCVTLTGFLFLIVPGFETAAAIVIGLGQASSFPLALTLISTSTRVSAKTTEVSAIVQGGGYILSAVGTFAFAAIQQATGFWTLSIVMLAVLTSIQAVSSFSAGAKSRID